MLQGNWSFSTGNPWFLILIPLIVPASSGGAIAASPGWGRFDGRLRSCSDPR